MYISRIKSIYQESVDAGTQYRKDYLNGVRLLIDKKKEEAQLRRVEFGKKICTDPEYYRQKFCEILGWPLTEPPLPIHGVREICLYEDASQCISRLQIEIFPDLWFYGILMIHKGEKKPIIISQHGGGGAPERVCSFFDSCNYNDMSLRIFHKGVHVFSPQLLLWTDQYVMEEACRTDLEDELRRLDGSVMGLEIYCLQRCMDHLETLPVFNGKFGMIGLSYGGFYSMYTAACDTRISAVLNSSFFNDRTLCCGDDFAWKSSFLYFGDAEVGALVHPRPLWIEIGSHDKSKWVSGASGEYERLHKYYTNTPKMLNFHVFDGGHEFCPEDNGIDWIIDHLNCPNSTMCSR